MTPKTKAQAGDNIYIRQITWEDRCRTRKELLSATSADLIAIADILEKTVNDGGICMVGGKEKLAKCGELESVITL
jgi:Zn-dependent M16 (insulinase) family peptidase